MVHHSRAQEGIFEVQLPFCHKEEKSGEKKLQASERKFQGQGGSPKGRSGNIKSDKNVLVAISNYGKFVLNAG